MEQVPKDSLILPKTHQQAILTMLDAFKQKNTQKRSSLSLHLWIKIPIIPWPAPHSITSLSLT